MPTLPDGTRNGPFARVLIADLTHALSGPFCTMLLAELGARVVKIERPPAGDVARSFAPMVDGQSAYFANINRGKESSWADPERDVAAALLTSGKPTIYPQILDLYDVLRQIGLACPKIRDGSRSGSDDRRSSASAA
jgi:hypothetical protein